MRVATMALALAACGGSPPPARPASPPPPRFTGSAIWCFDPSKRYDGHDVEARTVDLGFAVVAVHAYDDGTPTTSRPPGRVYALSESARDRIQTLGQVTVARAHWPTDRRIEGARRCLVYVWGPSGELFSVDRLEPTRRDAIDALVEAVYALPAEGPGLTEAEIVARDPAR